ncbi:hypothetical protein RO21_10350 [[Actinobacillus] muris]|uniref:PspA/IM30 family protein n=1 Tax=Muribacter muris TaxID=67855 RepID=A0A0J5S1E3_9PAST|nr:hypothetical protein [Muribacter muris]KMK50687.1 hypothetical protein RO21_10350 [[Actinobacillus] muris] [Muribacter muris]
MGLFKWLKQVASVQAKVFNEAEAELDNADKFADKVEAETEQIMQSRQQLKQEIEERRKYNGAVPKKEGWHLP